MSHLDPNFLKSHRNKGYICKQFFTTGTCPITSECPFAHVRNGQVDTVPQQVCAFFHQKACLRDSCPYFHGSETELYALKKFSKRTYMPQDYMEQRDPLDLPPVPPPPPAAAAHEAAGKQWKPTSKVESAAVNQADKRPPPPQYPGRPMQMTSMPTLQPAAMQPQLIPVHAMPPPQTLQPMNVAPQTLRPVNIQQTLQPLNMPMMVPKQMMPQLIPVQPQQMMQPQPQVIFVFTNGPPPNGPMMVPANNVQLVSAPT
jgi:hypothetical protein